MTEPQIDQLKINTQSLQVISKNPLYREIHTRIFSKNKNFLIAVCGPTGSGKSWAALKLAWDLQLNTKGEHTFTPDNIVFSADEFLKIIQERKNKGTVIIWDEVGIGINSRTFFEKTNLVISYVTQTFRLKNFVVIYTLPAFKYMDKQVRELFHAYLEMIDHYPKYNKSFGKFSWIHYDAKESKDVYYKFPRILTNDQKYVVSEVMMDSPPKELVEEYEKRKEEMIDKAYIKYGSDITTSKEKNEQKKKIDLIDYAEHVEKDIHKYTKGGKLSAGLIMKHLKISQERAYSIIRILNSEA